MTERALQQKVMKWLKTLNKTWVNKSPSPWDKRGIVDILGGLKGRYVVIELKEPGKYKNPHEGLSSEQMTFLSEVKKDGGVAVVADSLETVQHCLLNESSGCCPVGNFSEEIAAVVRSSQPWIKRQSQAQQRRSTRLR